MPPQSRRCKKNGVRQRAHAVFQVFQNAQFPSRKTATVLPSPHTASMLMSAEPIMKSSWTMESLTPSARHSSSVLCSKSRMVSAKPMPSARWQAAFSSNSVL